MQTSHSSRINFKYCEHLPTLSLYLFIPSRIPLYPLSPPLMNLRINDAADGKISIQPINSAVLCQSHNSFLTIFSLVMDIRHYTTHLQISRLTIGVNPYSGTILLQTPLSSIIIHTHLYLSILIHTYSYLSKLIHTHPNSSVLIHRILISLSPSLHP